MDWLANFPLKVNKSVYIAKSRQRDDITTLKNFLLHVPNHALMMELYKIRSVHRVANRFY